MQKIEISDREFAQFQAFIYESAGITLSPSKKALVCGRLAKRLSHCGVDSYDAYFRLLKSGQAGGEVQTAIDLLTTNETYFFREPKHFDFLREQALKAKRSEPFRVWSAACSTGEEPYSMAMVLADCLEGHAWEVLASDISTRVLQRAQAAHYTMERARHVPQAYLKRFCLKGLGEQEGTMLVSRTLRSRLQFRQVNLNAPLPQLGLFDIVFLRNVMIYFNGETKRDVVGRIAMTLKPGGYLCIGHSETLNDVSDAVKPVVPSIYRKP